MVDDFANLDQHNLQRYEMFKGEVKDPMVAALLVLAGEIRATGDLIRTIGGTGEISVVLSGQVHTS